MIQIPTLIKQTGMWTDMQVTAYRLLLGKCQARKGSRRGSWQV